MSPTPSIFLTLPPSRPPSRRRDPLGFSDVAAYYADLLAPGLTNRQRDARWLSILCWSIQQVQLTFPDLDSDKRRYDKLRGLELRWVIEACARADDGKGRQLPGSDRVRKLKKAAGGFLTLRDQMGGDQWRRYRHVGPYAAYRGLLQSLDLLDGGGWQLTAKGRKLAAVVDQCAAIDLRATKLRQAAPSDEANGWVGYWLRRWRAPAGQREVNTFLPTNRGALRAAELKLLAPALFETSSVRRLVAESLGRAGAARHADLCRHLQKELLGQPHWPSEDRVKLRKFAGFAVLADAAVDAMRTAFDLVARHGSAQPGPGAVAGAMAAQLAGLGKTCRSWRHDGVWPTVDAFAREIAAAGTPRQILVALVTFHERQASGLVWLRLSHGALDRSVLHPQAPAGHYRFRLGALGSLALGCDVIQSLPPCLAPATTSDTDDNEE